MEISLSPFLQAEAQNGTIDDQQVAQIISLVDAGIPIETLLGPPLNLHQKFIRFHQQNRHTSHINSVQQTIISKRLQKYHPRIAELKTSITVTI